MKKISFTLLRKLTFLSILTLLLLKPGTVNSQTTPSLMLFDFENKFNIRNVASENARPKLLPEGKNHLLQVSFNLSDRPNIKLSMPPKDLSGYLGIAMDIRNMNPFGIAIEAQCYSVNPESAARNRQFNKSLIWLEPGETDILYITFYRNAASLPEYIRNSFKGMNGLPGGYVQHWEIVDLKNITNVDVYMRKPGNACTFIIDNIRAIGKYDLPAGEKLSSSFFPFVDKFGQYLYGEWPGKTRTTEDIIAQKNDEQEDLRSNPGPSDWDKYGGWNNGPKLKAIGHFRVEKYQNKWWLVDPDGNLFWSQGIDCVIFSQNTPVAGRENYFTAVPPNGDYRLANLLLKYNNLWNISPRDTAASTIHTRLRSWGINTIANWSDAYIYGQRRTPYTATLSSGIPKRMPSKLDEAEFRATCAARLARGVNERTKNDPWCIGYFVDNELTWPAENAPGVIDTYYRIVKEELKKLAPEKLFLGSRINNNNQVALTVASKYCDIVSINRYDYTVSDFSLPQGIDMPVIIGEFHFGALDRGLPHTGLRSVLNQKQRAAVYRNYINQALESPMFVGAHWFQFSDQVCTGRSDGENYQIGFVDICDRPYPEMVAAARQFGSYIYSRRSSGSLTAAPKQP